jgi:hypothetical protein
MPSPGRLAPQQRPRALVELEVVIAKAEAERDRYRQSMNRACDDDELRRTKALLRIADERLAQLHRSRETLIGGEDQAAAEDEAEAS